MRKNVMDVNAANANATDMAPADASDSTCLVTAHLGDVLLQWELDSWTTMIVMSATAADPYTARDLEAAVRRYQPDRNLVDTGRSVSLEEAASATRPWCLIDFVGRTMVAGNDCQLPDNHTAYIPDPNEPYDGFPIVWFCASRAWMFREAADGWQQIVAARRAEALATCPVDIRAALYGRPLVEHILTETRRTAEGSDSSWSRDKKERRRHTRRIHASWLMTPRDDLGGLTPRDAIVGDCRRIDADREQRAEQWSKQGFPPPSLEETSRAYRYGWMGTTEAVIYFDLVRNLIARAWELAGAEGGESLHRGAQLRDTARDVEELERCRDAWLTQPLDDGEPRSAGQLIELERTRMPIVVTSEELDCDCPLCLAMATSDRPTFTWFQPTHLECEDMFAFSLSETHDQWKSDRPIYAGYDSENDDSENDNSEFDDSGFDASQKTPSTTNDRRKDASMLLNESQPQQPDPRIETLSTQAGAPVVYESNLPHDESESVWKRSFVNWESLPPADTHGELPRLAIGFLLAEFATELKALPDSRQLLAALNAAYLRFHASTGKSALRDAAKDLTLRIEAIGQSYPSLVSQSADLQSRLDEVLRMAETAHGSTQ